MDSGPKEQDTLSSDPRSPSDGSDSAEQASKNRDLKMVLLNLIALTVLIVAGCSWLYFFTEWGPLISVVVGAGGTLWWATSLLTKCRRAEILSAIDKRVLQSKCVCVCLCILALIAASLPFTTGTIILDASADTAARKIEIQRVGKQLGADIGDPFVTTIQAGSTKKVPRLCLPLFGKEYRLRTSQLPDLSVALHGFTRARVYFPNSAYEQPVVIIKPHGKLATQIAIAEDVRISIMLVRDGETIELRPVNVRADVPYRGQTLWLGASATVEVPASIRSKWTKEIARLSLPRAWESVWEYPLELEPNITLRMNDEIQVTLNSANRNSERTESYTIEKPEAIDSFQPQDFELSPFP